MRGTLSTSPVWDMGIFPRRIALRRCATATALLRTRWRSGYRYIPHRPGRLGNGARWKSHNVWPQVPEALRFRRVNRFAPSATDRDRKDTSIPKLFNIGP